MISSVVMNFRQHRAWPTFCRARETVYGRRWPLTVTTNPYPVPALPVTAPRPHVYKPRRPFYTRKHPVNTPSFAITVCATDVYTPSDHFYTPKLPLTAESER
jgi:hypothetical protein